MFKTSSIENNATYATRYSRNPELSKQIKDLNWLFSIKCIYCIAAYARQNQRQFTSQRQFIDKATLTKENLCVECENTRSLKLSQPMNRLSDFNPFRKCRKTRQCAFGVGCNRSELQRHNKTTAFFHSYDLSCLNDHFLWTFCCCCSIFHSISTNDSSAFTVLCG